MKTFDFVKAGSFVLALGLLAGCGHQSGSFNASSFHQGRYGYDVRYANPAALGILSPDWQLDNFYTAGATLQTKTDDIYTSDYTFDLDGDGRPDTATKLPTYDLRLVHQRVPAVIWLRSIPANAFEGPRDLKAVMQDYVASVAGVGCEMAQLGTGLTAPRYATQIIDEHPGTVAGHEAFSATLDVTDQMPMGQEPRHKRAKIVLVRAALTHTENTVSYGKRELPVFLLAGYSNQPELFEQGVPEFHAFLGQIVLRGYFGYAEQPGVPVGPGPGAMPGQALSPQGATSPGAAETPVPGAPMNSTAASAVGAEEAGKKPEKSHKGKKH